MKKVKFTVIDESVLDESKNNKIPNSFPSSTPNNNNFNIRSQIYQAISNIYKNFLMTKTNQYENFGVYKALCESYVHSDIRYIVAIVPNDNNPVGISIPLSELNWISFQTRMTKNSKEFKSFDMSPRTYTLPNKSILHDKITRVLETKEKTVYSTENLPISIEIIHIKEDDTFTDKGTVIAALELFQTVLTFNE